MVYIFTLFLLVSFAIAAYMTKKDPVVIKCDSNFYPHLKDFPGVWCAINTITGIKRCPVNGETITPDIDTESCTRKDFCDFPILKYTVVPDLDNVPNPGSTVLDPGILKTYLPDFDTGKLRCSHKKQCDNNVLVAWSLDNGYLNQITGYNSYTGGQIKSAPLQIDDNDYCSINEDLLIRSGICDSFDECVERGNLCSMGKLTVIVDDVSSSTTTQQRTIGCLANMTGDSQYQFYYTKNHRFKNPQDI